MGEVSYPARVEPLCMRCGLAPCLPHHLYCRACNDADTQARGAAITRRHLQDEAAWAARHGVPHPTPAPPPPQAVCAGCGSQQWQTRAAGGWQCLVCGERA